MLNSTSRTVKLVLAGDESPVAVNFPVSGDGGVDLGAIGRSLGLDPATVRLNGHFLSRGPHLVSSVTWASLLSFFSSRGFPAGGSDRDAIVVEGKTAADENYLSLKRMIRLEDENPAKKNRVSQNNANVQKEVVNDVVSDDESICIGRRLKLDENPPSKKRKISRCNLGLASEASDLAPKIGFVSYNKCISSLGKRLRGEEMVTPVSCKRIN